MPAAAPTTRTAVLVLLVLLALLALLAQGCGSDDGPPSTSAAGGDPAPSLEPVPPSTGHGAVANPSAQDAGPGIDAASAPSRVGCTAGADAVVPVTWSAPAATVVRFVVDGQPVAGDRPPSGQAEVAVPCDGAVHVVLVVAVGDQPEPSLASLAVLTEPGA